MPDETPAAPPVEPPELRHLRARKADLEAKLAKPQFDAASKARTQRFIEQVNEEIKRIEEKLAKPPAAQATTVEEGE